MSNIALIFLLLTMLLIAIIWLEPVIRKLRRNQLTKQPFPEFWHHYLCSNLPIYHQLPQFWQQKLQSQIVIILAEKKFIGCQGLKVTMEMKLAITAQACLLTLHDPQDYYPNLVSILIYPSAYVVTQINPLGDYVVTEEKVTRLGESWHRGQVVLAWDQIEYDLRHWQDGHNLVLHEFAHQLDYSDRAMNGVPLLPANIDLKRWSYVFTQAYQQLQQELASGNRTMIDPYAATNPAEFFAVVTEHFWEQPHQLQRYNYQLYQLLQEYYQSW